MQQSYPSTAYRLRWEVMQPGDVISVQFHKRTSRDFTPGWSANRTLRLGRDSRDPPKTMWRTRETLPQADL